MERVDTQTSPELQQGVPSLASVEVAPMAGAPLAELVQRARAPGSTGNLALTDLISTLDSLPPTEANATALVELLDAHAFDELKTEDGAPTRELAIRSLLKLGWPFALRVAPEDLDWLRAQRNIAFQRNVLFFLVLVGAGIGIWNLVGSML